MTDYTEFIMPDEVKAYLDDKAETNRRCGYEMYKIVDVNFTPIDTPEGEIYSDVWETIVYNTTSCMVFCKTWTIFTECGERKVVESISQVPLGVARRIARKIEEVA
jgi:hypothetical protein